MTYLSNALELLSEGDATSETIRVVLNSDMNDIVAAAEEMGEETDYVLESALEKAKELAEELRNLKELVRNRYLLLDTIPNGTQEINVRAAEYLAQLNNGIEPFLTKTFSYCLQVKAGKNDLKLHGRFATEVMRWHLVLRNYFRMTHSRTKTGAFLLGRERDSMINS